MEANHRPVLTIVEARRRATEALEALDRGQPIIPDDLGDLISTVDRLADQVERSRRELAEVQAEYVQLDAASSRCDFRMRKHSRGSRETRRGVPRRIRRS